MDFNSLLELTTSFFQDVYNYIMPLIDWMVFALVIASGYFVRVTKLLPKKSTTTKVLLSSLFVTVLYTLVQGVPWGMFIASYFLAFGFHSSIIKLIERKVSGNKNSSFRSGVESQAIVGDRPDDR